ncbi:MAG: cellulase family glycosylhydrolase [Planctomycetales bacterium]|nr:cellulase family glycosylhydrolase [Planctomycetales bacterium]
MFSRNYEHRSKLSSMGAASMIVYRKVLLSLIAGCTFCTSSYGEAPVEMSQFVTRLGDKLMVGDQEFRFISFNIPNLHLVEDNFSFTQPNPWRWPDEYEIADALESVRQLGGTVVRIYVLSVQREGSDMGDHVFVKGPGEFNEAAYRVLDQVLAVANQKGIRVIIPFVDNWHWWGGATEYAKFRGKDPKAFWTDEQLIADFEETLRYTLERKNTITGVAYKDDPAVFGWETGNEIDSTPEWTRRIASYIKERDSNHLVIDGYSLHGVRQESLDDPNIDVITTHHYPNTDQDYVQAILKAHQQTKGLKPYFVGEFGFVPTDRIRAVLDTVVEQGISGALLWSLRFHSRDGGFYWHWESAINGLYKAYHWPGFETGEGYYEKQVLTLMRNKAFEIRGLAVPDMEAPAAPKLFEVSDVDAISWQGSAGADRYDVERSASPDGPWQVVGPDVSDAAVQYRPLFSDTTAAIGEKYHYRVIAKNSAGQSPPSNIVRSSKVRWKTLVDECRDFELLAGYEGGVTFVGDDERKTQEDIHRLRLEKGGSVTYQVERPIDGWQIYLFASDKEAKVLVECSEDGQEFAPCKVQRQSIEVGSGDYGYHLPLLLKSSPDARGGRYLRISVASEGSTTGVQLSRVEIRYGGAKQDRPRKEATNATHGAVLNPSVLLFHKPHQLEGVQAVRHAARLGSQCVNVVVTLLCQLDEQRQVVGYGVLRKGRFIPLDERALADFQETIRRTFAEAVAHDMDIAVLAHLNSWGEVDDWRNYFQFDPLARYSGYSYEQAMIQPIKSALEAAVSAKTEVEIALAGEMGCSVFGHADSYRTLLKNFRSSTHLPHLQLGVSLNFNRVSGEYQPTEEEQAEVQELVHECDFLGLSNYYWFDLPPAASGFSKGVEYFLRGMESHGVSVPPTLPLHFSEVGIGGCTVDGQLASSPEQAALTPWEGSDRLARNPWKSEAMRRFRLQYHQALLDFLQHQPESHRVTKAFLWSEGSWDPMDVTQAGFADEAIIALIQKHNAMQDDL